MVDTRITKARVRHHFSYGIWKYVLLAALAIFGWDLIYSMTAYRPPADKKLDVYIVSLGADVENLHAAVQEPLRAVFPDQEAFSFLHIGLGADMDPNAVMQFTTYVGAQQGDLFLLSMDLFRQYGRDVEGGLFLPLDDAIACGALSIEGIDIGPARFTPLGSEPGMYGIPAKTLFGLTDYAINNEHMVWAIPAYSGNVENAVKLISFLVKRFTTEKPEWYDEYQLEMRRQQQEQMLMSP
jgi:hypothetical protein